MTLKVLKEIIKGKRIDRVAGFCNSYEQMIDRCRLDVHNGPVVIDTSDDGDNDNQFEPVPKVIDQLLAMPSEYDDYPVLKSGFDNNFDNEILLRQVIGVRFEHSQSDSVGLCLLGREPIRFVDDEDFLDLGDMYHVEIVVEDPRAKNLNEKFDDFIHASCNWFRPDENCYDEENWSIYSKKNFTVITFVTDESSSSSLIALIAGAFDGVYFSRTLLNKDVDERLSNDSEGKYFGPWQAVIFPACTFYYDKDIPHLKPGLTAIAGSGCFVKECASKDEMEQFIASHNPDEAVGDLVRRITTLYIDDPLELILEK